MVDIVCLLRAGHIGNVVGDDVKLPQLHQSLFTQRLQPCRLSHLEVVQAYHPFQAQLVLEVGQKADEVETQKARAAGQ